MEPVNFFQAAVTQPPTEPERTDAAQKAGQCSGHHGLPQRIRRFPQNKRQPQQNRFSRQGNTEIVQEHDDEDEHISIMRDMRQQRMQPVNHVHRPSTTVSPLSESTRLSRMESAPVSRVGLTSMV